MCIEMIRDMYVFDGYLWKGSINFKMHFRPALEKWAGMRNGLQ